MDGWAMIGVAGLFEYWQAPHGGDVYRRKVWREGLGLAPDGTPMAVRWESTRAHYDRFVAPAVSTSIPREGSQ